MLYYAIAPLNHLDLVADEPRHLVVAQFLRRPRVMEFFCKQVKRGNKVILDNGAYEFGKPMDVEEYLEFVIQLQPEVVVAPDAWKDGPLTVERTLDFVDRFYKKDCNGKIMVVPQGATIPEVVACKNRICLSASILGMSVGTWEDTSGMIRAHWVRNIGASMPIHILGLWNILEMKWHLTMSNGRLPSYLRSIDTSMPFKAAFKNVRLADSDGIVFREKMNFDGELTLEQENLAKDNLKSMREFLEHLPSSGSGV